MSNPTTLVESFTSDSGGFTIAGPERYDGGLWLEEGTTNELANPSFETNTTDWGLNNTGNTIARVTTRATDGIASLRILGDGSVSQQGASNSGSSPTAASGEKWALSADIFGVGGETVRFVASERTGAGASVVDTQGPTLTLASGWERRNFVATLAGGGTVGQVRFKFFTPTAQVIDLNLDACQLEKKPYATSYTAGTRAASSAALDPTGILDPVSGSLAFRVTPTIETGLEELWGECGVKGSGTDHLRWGRDSSKHPFVEWSSNDAAYQRLTASETLAALSQAMLYLGHSGTAISLQVDDGTLQTDTRDTPSGSWGAGDLVLEASAGGVVYDGFATFEGGLTAAQISTLYHTQNWSLSLLEPEEPQGGMGVRFMGFHSSSMAKSHSTAQMGVRWDDDPNLKPDRRGITPKPDDWRVRR